jgi:hypothetical protein
MPIVCCSYNSTSPFLEIPPPWGLTLQFILPSTWELLNPQEDMHRFTSLFSFTVKSNPLYGQASNMGTCLQVVDRTWVQLYSPTLSFRLWVLCLLHAKYSIYPGYKIFLTGLENTFLLCSGDQPKKLWSFTHRMRSPKLDENVYASINHTGVFYSWDFAKKRIKNLKIENGVILELSNHQNWEGKTLKKSPDLYILILSV